MLSNEVGCQFGAPGNPLLLTEAIERALCGSPKTREAWADVKLQAAGVGVARSAYLPTITGNGQMVRQNSITDVTGHPTLSSATLGNINTESVSLNWTLYDFGARAAALRNASALLAGCRPLANQKSPIIKGFRAFLPPVPSPARQFFA